MIARGIALAAVIHDDCSTMMSRSTSTEQETGDVAFAICEASAIATRTHALLGVLWSRLDTFAVDPGSTRTLAVYELEQLAAMGDEVAELSSQIALILDSIPLDPLVVGEQELIGAARAALAGGIADHCRALAAVGLLTADQGFPALAEALIDTDAHAYWNARVVDMLAAFRDVDDLRARQTAALAGVADTACFCELEPQRVLELAHILRRLGAR
jgi:hypothetical protein